MFTASFGTTRRAAASYGITDELGIAAKDLSPEQLANYLKEGKILAGSAHHGGKIAQKLGFPAEGYDHQAFLDSLEGKYKNAKTKQASNPKRCIVDVTFGPPKSVSVAKLVLDDNRIAAIEKAAELKAMEFFESLVRVRVTKDKETVSMPVEGIAWTRFQHLTSRDGDPQSHPHYEVNKQVFGPDGQLMTADFGLVLKSQHLIDAIYQAELKRGLEEIGYQTIQTKNGFELAGIDRELCDHFSKGSKRVDEYLKKQGLTRATATGRQRDHANMLTKSAKEIKDIKEMKVWWRDQAQAINQDGFNKSKEAVKATMSAEAIKERAEREPARQPDLNDAIVAMKLAIDSQTERSSVITNRANLVAEAMRFSNYSITPTMAEEAIEYLIEKKEIYVGKTNPNILVTREQLIIEAEIKRGYENSLGKSVSIAQPSDIEHLITETEAKMGGKMTKGQSDAIHAICSNTDRITLVEGDAGTGKSTAMKAVADINTANGWKTVGLAPTGKAKAALSESIEDVQTTQHACVNEKYWAKIDNKTVIVIDEAGLLDARSMRTLLKRAEEKGAKVAFVGDRKQFKSVEAGTPFAQMCAVAEKEGKLHRLDEMRRGKTEEMREMHFASRDDQAKCIDMLFERGKVVALQTDKRRLDAIATSYLKVPEDERANSIILTGMNKDRIAINDIVRTKLGLKDKIGIQADTFERKDLTKSQLQSSAFYEPGDSVRFEKKSGSIKVGEIFSVKDKRPDGTVILARADGSTIDFKPAIAGKNVTLGVKEKIDVVQDERIRFTANYKDLGIINADTGTVKGLDIKSGRAQIELDRKDKDGKPILVHVDLSKEGISLRHGYAATGHSAQGLTLKNVFIHMRSDDPTVDRNSFYTNLTRSSTNVQVFTDAKEGRRLADLYKKVTSANVAMSAEGAMEIRDEAGRKAAPPNRIWAGKGHEHIDLKPGDDVKAKLVEAHKRFGKDLHVSGDRDFIKKSVEVAAKTDKIAFKDPDLKAMVADTRASMQAATQKAAEAKQAAQEAKEVAAAKAQAAREEAARQEAARLAAEQAAQLARGRSI